LSCFIIHRNNYAFYEPQVIYLYFVIYLIPNISIATGTDTTAYYKNNKINVKRRKILKFAVSQNRQLHFEKENIKKHKEQMRAYITEPFKYRERSILLRLRLNVLSDDDEWRAAGGVPSVTISVK
jgi:hypothetical protein